MNGQVMGSQLGAGTVALAGAGDKAAFAQLVAAYHGDMARVAFVVCGDRELAMDAVQSAWLAAWQKLHSLRDPDRIRQWLLSVSANEARQLVRRRRGPVIQIDVDLPGDPLLHVANAGACSVLYNVVGLPAGAVPVTTVRPDEETDRPASRDPVERAALETERGSAGLPVGVQVAARAWREDLVLAGMAAIERGALRRIS